MKITLPIIGWINPSALPIAKGSDELYIVDEDGADGCTLPVYAQSAELECGNGHDIKHLRGLIKELLDTELAEIACAGSHAPVEDILGRMRDALDITT